MFSLRLAAVPAIVLAACLAAAAASPASANCVVYQHRDFKGASYRLNDGDSLQMGGEPCGRTQSHGTPRGRMLYNRSWNDQVSSFRVGAGCTITLWQHVQGCRGGGAYFRANQSHSYVGSRWNDQTSFVDCTCRRR
jgi:hypothetical protein